MLRKAEKDGERIEDSNRQCANSSYESLPNRKTMGLMTAMSRVTNRSQTQCSLCLGHHPIDTCRCFIEMNTTNRLSLVRRERRCLSCFGHNHWITTCPRKVLCDIDSCLEFHSRLLHFTGNIIDSHIHGRSTRLPNALQELKRTHLGGDTPLSLHKRLRQTPLRAIMPPDPSTSNTNPEATSS
ncbi:hypothetical protein E2C01_097074 [Portunus trituberculatus]|uniref:Uncharacterized protein n=1 Tax=Portunus trituberculatus TaxID=210409 RepID=A0A5B7JU83_PORTR|nr:hypothetical protein [Portunus trituberculatus]